MTEDEKIESMALMLLAMDEDKECDCLAEMSPALRASVELARVQILHRGKRQTADFFRRSFEAKAVHRQSWLRRMFRR